MLQNFRQGAVLLLNRYETLRLQNIFRRQKFAAIMLTKQLPYCCTSCPRSHYKQKIVFSTNDCHGFNVSPGCYGRPKASCYALMVLVSPSGEGLEREVVRQLRASVLHRSLARNSCDRSRGPRPCARENGNPTTNYGGLAHL